ncbi:MAG: hypothetical protein ABI954_00245 [Pyrinomonadaceae bacterium]
MPNRVLQFLIAFSLIGFLPLSALSWCGEISNNDFVAKTTLFANPERVVIKNYNGNAMEPFLTRDGRYLFFNNLNEAPENTNLHYAERQSDTFFLYKGELAGVNTASLEGVPTMDKNNVFYFVSLRNYNKTFSTIYGGEFSNGTISNIALVKGISRKKPGIVNFDVEISPDGNTMYFVDGDFTQSSSPKKADLVVAVKTGDGFKRIKDSAELLKNINTKDLEYAPSVSGDGKELFFTRLRLGILTPTSVGIFRATRTTTDQPFGTPEIIEAITGDFFEAPALSADENSLYYHKKENGVFVIYKVTRQIVKP